MSLKKQKRDNRYNVNLTNDESDLLKLSRV